MNAKMNTESVVSTIDSCRKKKNYHQLHRVLKRRCEEISKDNDALSARLVKLKYLVYNADNQRRRLQERLEMHGIDYHTAAAVAAAQELSACEKDESELPMPVIPKSSQKSSKRPKGTTTEHVLNNLPKDEGIF